MGLFDFFRRRRDRESVTAGLSMGTDPSQQMHVQTGTDEAAFRSQDEIELQGETYDLAGLGQLGALIAQAARDGNIQVHQGTPQEIDLRGTGLREEILGIMQAHGVNAEPGSGQQIDASQTPGMQQQILDALSQHGVDVQGAGGGGFQTDATGGFDIGGDSGYSGSSDSGGDSGSSDSGGGSGGGSE